MTSLYSSPKKFQARQETIAQFRSPLVGTSLQWWTLAGLSCQQGQLVPGCELAWAVEAGLVEPHQFHGVDYDQGIVEQNRQLGQGNWYQGYFYEVLRDQDVTTFRPGLVNYDSLVMPKIGVPYFARILQLLCATPLLTDCVLVGNFLLTARHWHVTVDEIAVQMKEQVAVFRLALACGWTWNGEVYEYYGSADHKRTRMGSVVLYFPPR